MDEGLIVIIGTFAWYVYFLVGVWLRILVFEDVDPKNTSSLLHLTLLLHLWPLILATRSVAVLGKLFDLLVQGVSRMKRKLLVTLVLMALGGEMLPSLGYKPQLFDRVVAWWNAPPAPPSPEAQQLIESLESSDGWVIGQSNNGYSHLRKGNIMVTLHTFRADVAVGEFGQAVNVNGSFTNPEAMGIQNAAEKCLRKLTAKALETAAK